MSAIRVNSYPTVPLQGVKIVVHSKSKKGKQMTFMEASAYKMPFGKHKDIDLWVILEKDPTYIDWLAGQDWKSGNPELAESLKVFLGHADVQRKLDEAVFD